MTDDPSLHPGAPGAEPPEPAASVTPPDAGADSPEAAAGVTPPDAGAESPEPAEPAATQPLASGPSVPAAGAGSDATEAPAERSPAPDAPDGGRHMPEYKGGDLDPARGPGLGCFWFQAAVLVFFLVLIPVGISLNWPFELLAVLLFIVIFLLLFVGQTVIFLLRLVAADRRSTGGRRRPLASASRTVGELEDAQAPLGTTVARTVDDVEAERIAHAAAIRATGAERSTQDPSPGRRVVAPAQAADQLGPAVDPGGTPDNPDGAAGSSGPGMRQ